MLNFVKQSVWEMESNSRREVFPPPRWEECFFCNSPLFIIGVNGQLWVTFGKYWNFENYFPVCLGGGGGLEDDNRPTDPGKIEKETQTNDNINLGQLSEVEKLLIRLN